MAVLAFRVIDSPLGPLTLAGTGSTLMHLRMIDQTHDPDRSKWQHEPNGFADIADQLSAYFAGELEEFDVDLALFGTDFQRRVWAALRTIPYGQTRSYGQLAEQIGSPGGARAVGLANGRNPVAIIVPCHRVVGSSGAMTGYGGGIDRKRALLDLEANRTSAQSALFD